MEAHFATVFENVRPEWSRNLLLSLTDPDILKQSKFADHEISKIINLALGTLNRQRMLKEYTALQILE